MKLEEAKLIAKQAIASLNNDVNDEIFDDGRNTGNFAQNCRFNNSFKIIEEWQRKLANIEISGIESSVLDSAWRDAAGPNFHSNLPECLYNRAMNYANFILNL